MVELLFYWLLATGYMLLRLNTAAENFELRVPGFTTENTD
jgi:hypothetical protein